MLKSTLTTHNIFFHKIFYYKIGIRTCSFFCLDEKNERFHAWIESNIPEEFYEYATISGEEKSPRTRDFPHPKAIRRRRDHGAGETLGRKRPERH